MDTKQAIEILDNVTAQIPLVRADQAKVLQALAVLREALLPPKEPLAAQPPPTEATNVT